MERAIIRLTPENFISVAILSAAAYLGVVGATQAVKWVKSRTGVGG